METAKQHLKKFKHFKESQILVPVFFLVTGSLTLIAAGCTYTSNSMHHIAKHCYAAGILLAVLSIIYSIAMIFLSPYVKRLFKHAIEWKQRRATVVEIVEEGLSATCSEDVLAADGEGIAFGPKRRRKTSKDTLSELLSKEKKDSRRESDSHLRGSLESHSQHSRKDSGGRRLSRSSKPNFPGQAIDLGEQDESEILEKAAELLNTG